MTAPAKGLCANQGSKERCNRAPVKGHIYCNPCRVMTGGYLRKPEAKK